MTRTHFRIPILALTAIILATIITVIACAPTDASPTSTVVPTTANTRATAAPDTFHIPQAKPTPTGKTLSEQIKEYDFPTTTGVAPIIDQQLQQEIDSYKVKKADRTTRGITTEPEIIHVHIFAKSPEDLDRHLQFMRDNGATDILSYKTESTSARANGLTGRIRIDLIEEAGRLPGVELITPVQYMKPLGSLRQSNTQQTDAVQIHGASIWHAAGITGNGAEIGILDSNFRGFVTQIPGPTNPRASTNLDTEQTQFLCFITDTTVSESDFSYCEDGPENPGHGAQVANTVKEIAPNAKLYISNARNRVQLQIAVQWMTAKQSDNGSTRPYDTSANDDFNVKVINNSRSSPWDGPGDGTSWLIPGAAPSPLETLDTATANGAIWVNAAGNQNQLTWFSRSPHFGSDILHYDALHTNVCNSTYLSSATTHTFYLRWADTPNAEIDLNLYLFGPNPLTSLGPPSSSIHTPTKWGGRTIPHRDNQLRPGQLRVVLPRCQKQRRRQPKRHARLGANPKIRWH